MTASAAIPSQLSVEGQPSPRAGSPTGLSTRFRSLWSQATELVAQGQWDKVADLALSAKNEIMGARATAPSPEPPPPSVEAPVPAAAPAQAPVAAGADQQELPTPVVADKAADSPTAVARLGPFEISGHLLGEGGYGRVVLAQHVESGEQVAVKTMVTNSPNTVMREINAMRRAGAHDHLCGLRGYFSGHDGRTFSLVLDLCQGGELFAKVEEFGALPEADAHRYFVGMLHGVRHLHSVGIAHRDLKLENVLLGGPSNQTPKICDFGLAHVYRRLPDNTGFENPSLSQWCGSRSYCPPEIMARLPYDGYRADLWSLGVALFAMASGFFPVEEATQRDWRFSRLALLQLRGSGAESTTHAVYSFYSRPCPLSPALVELLDQMLMLQPPRRLPLDEAMTAPWVVGGPSATPTQVLPELPTPAASTAVNVHAATAKNAAADGSTPTAAAGPSMVLTDDGTPDETPEAAAAAAAAMTASEGVEAEALRPMDDVDLDHDPQAVLYRSSGWGDSGSVDEMSGPPQLRRNKACSQHVGCEWEVNESY